MIRSTSATLGTLGLCTLLLGACQSTPVYLSSPETPDTRLKTHVVTNFYLDAYVEQESDREKLFDVEAVSEITTVSRTIDLRRHPTETLERTEYNFPCTGGPEDAVDYVCTDRPDRTPDPAKGTGCALPKPSQKYASAAYSCQNGSRTFDIYRAGHDCDPPGEALRVLQRDRDGAPVDAVLVGEQATLVVRDGKEDELIVRPADRVYFISEAVPVDFGSPVPQPDLASLLSTPPAHRALAGARPLAFRLDLRAMPQVAEETPPSQSHLSSAAGFCTGGDQVVSAVYEAASKVDRQMAYSGGEKHLSYAWYGLDMTGVPETLFGEASRDAKDVALHVVDAASGEAVSRATVRIDGIGDALFTFAYFEKTYLTDAEDAFVRNLYRSLKDADLFRFTKAKDSYADGDILRVQNHRPLPLTIRVERSGYYPVVQDISMPLPVTSLVARLVPLPGKDEPAPEFKGEILLQ